MIRFQLRGAQETRTYKLTSDSTGGATTFGPGSSPTKPSTVIATTTPTTSGGTVSISLDRLYALARSHIDQYHPAISSKNIILSFIHPTTGEDTVLRFNDQVPDAITPIGSEPSRVLTIVPKKSGGGAWKVPRGRWRKGHVVGSGSTGNVYIASALDGGQVFAAKEILVNPESNAACVQRIKEEMDLFMKLPSNANIVQYYGMERSSCALHIFMEYVAGGSIRTLLNRLGRPLHESVIQDYTRQVLGGLAFLHQSNIVHGDIKGGNCLVDVDGTVKLADFGSSSKAESEWVGLRGTSLWMAPECVKGAGFSSASDVWSLGCTVIEMASGRPPWFEKHFTNDWAAMYFLSQTDTGPMVPSHLTPAAHDFLQLCFKINPSQRPPAVALLNHAFITQPIMNAVDVSDFAPMAPPPSWQEASLATSSGTIQSCQIIDPEKESAVASPHSHVDARGLMLPSINKTVSFSVVGEGAPHAVNVSVIMSPRAMPDAVKRALRSSIAERESSTSIQQSKPNGGGSLRTLPEPVLLNILLYLPPIALCSLMQVNRDISNTVNSPTMSEILWKRLFILTFGEVDPIRSALRKGWRLYYADSIKFRGITLAEGTLVFKRRLTHARNVYEGLNDLRQLVVLVVETVKHPASSGGGGGTSTRGLLSRETNPASINSSRTRTPQRRAYSNQPPARSPNKVSGVGGGGGFPSPAGQVAPMNNNSFTGTFANATMNSPLKTSPSLPTLSGRMVSPADVSKAQRIRKLQIDNMMNGSSHTTTNSVLALPNSNHTHGRDPLSRGGGDLYDHTPLLTPHHSSHPSLAHYHKIVSHLEATGVTGSVKSIDYYQGHLHNVLALPYLGTSLNELLLICGNKFTQKTVCQIAIRCIDILAEIHRRDVVHYCITPSHIVVSERGELNFINFKYAKSFSSSSVPTPSRRPSTGTASKHKEYLYFMSAYAQKGLTPGPRDDMIALGHVLCYLVHGGLPWIADNAPSEQELYMAKRNYPTLIAHTPPIQLHHFLRHCNELKQTELPDYAFLKNMITRLMSENRWVCDGVYDWTSQIGNRT